MAKGTMKSSLAVLFLVCLWMQSSIGANDQCYTYAGGNVYPGEQLRSASHNLHYSKVKSKLLTCSFWLLPSITLVLGNQLRQLQAWNHRSFYSYIWQNKCSDVYQWSWFKIGFNAAVEYCYTYIMAPVEYLLLIGRERACLAHSNLVTYQCSAPQVWSPKDQITSYTTIQDLHK